MDIEERLSKYALHEAAREGKRELHLNLPDVCSF